MQENSTSAVDRIIAVATELFYKQGYRATGVNEVIEKSEVAKATFYKHFPSKDDLGVVYLRALHAKEVQYLDQCISAQTSARNKLLAVIESLGPLMVDNQFRGCAFINIAAEVTDASSPMRKVGIEAYDEIRVKVRQLADELIASDFQKYDKLSAEALTEQYMILFAGAVAMAEVYSAIWPIEHALKAARHLIGYPL